MLEDQLLEEFRKQIHAEVDELLLEFGEFPLPADAALADVILGYLEEAGLVEEYVLCPHEDTEGRNRCRILGYSLADEERRLELFTAHYLTQDDSAAVSTSDLGRLTGRAAKFFQHVASSDLERFGANPDACRAARHIADNLDRINDVRVHVLTNGFAKTRSVDDVEVAGRTIEFSIYDVERIFRVSQSDVARDLIEIDFHDLLGHPLPCLEMRPRPKEYETYLAILPGDLIFQLYEQFGARLFEFNVRSFLQARGNVNKGLRTTLKDEPDRFLAYNNGITATADEIEVGLSDGQTVIRRIKGLQIVNGAQTTASIHRAKKLDGLEVANVAVSIKLTLVKPEKLNEFVPLIAKYANTQNVVQVADLSANSPFHIAVEQLSERVWCPGEESRWFYERARGAYQVAAMRYGTTPAKKREFRRECPKDKHFSKTDLAKCLMAWWQRPDTVSRGAQKNFAIFMDELPARFSDERKPDEAFYRDLIALVILFRTTRAIVRRAKLGGYGANVIAYTVAKLAHEFGDTLRLDMIWRYQELSPEFQRLLEHWVPAIHQELLDSAGRTNVTEWCKKSDCWAHMRELTLPEPREPIVEIHGDEAELPVAAERPAPEEDPAELCCRIDSAGWARLVAWAAQTGRVSSFHQQVANTLVSYALGGWRKRPSEKQARYGLEVIRAAERDGVLEPVD